MKLWEKSVQVNKDVESYTVGRDRELDVYLAPYDVLGSMAHITMLESVGLLTKEELAVLIKELKVIYKQAVSGEFVIEDGIEDVRIDDLVLRAGAALAGARLLLDLLQLVGHRCRTLLSRHGTGAKSVGAGEELASAR